MSLKNTQCLNCERSLSGRVDKKFCTDQCRNEYNNKLKYTDNNLIRNINNVLRKNRRVLEELFSVDPGKEKLIVPKSKLMERGFHFKYLTHLYTTKKGTVYYYCYEYGYFPLENNLLLLVKQK